MKKVIMAKIISLSVVVVLLTGILIVNLVNPGILGIFNLGFFGFGTFGNYTYNDAGYTVGSAELDGEIKNIYVDWVCGSVEFSVTDSKTLNIYEKASLELEDDYKLRYKLTNDNTIDIRFVRSGINITNGMNKNLIIEIPKDLAAEMSTVDVDVASADVVVNDITLKNLNTDTASGDITVINVKASSVFANTASGDVTFGGAEFEKLKCDTASGNMNFIGKSDDISFDAASGCMTAEFLTAPKLIYCNTASGDITLTMPKDIKGFSADLDSASGDLNCDFEGKLSGESLFSYGESGICKINADTASGNLNITKGK